MIRTLSGLHSLRNRALKLGQVAQEAPSKESATSQLEELHKNLSWARPGIDNEQEWLPLTGLIFYRKELIR